ncbi:MAG: (Fe-S)-binding protein [Halobacteriales archaeon]
MSETTTEPDVDAVQAELEDALGDRATVMTELEDRFVYSIEKWFDAYREPESDAEGLPELVVRVKSVDDTETARRILSAGGFRTVLRDSLEEPNLEGDRVALIDETDVWHLPADVDTQARSVDQPDLRIDHPTSTETFIQDRCEAHHICKGYCPINQTVYGDVEPFSAKGRAVISRELTTDAETPIEHGKRVSDILFSCATCGNCFRPCTDELTDMYEGLIEGKRAIIEDRDGHIPTTIQDMLENTFRKGNPNGMNPRQRADWTDDVEVDVPVLEPGDSVEVLLWVGCDPSYDDRNQAIAKSLARVFDALELDWGILGNDEQCAGNHQRAVGEEGLFEYLVEENAETFESVEFDTLVTADPHSFHSFKREYAEYDVDLDPLHYTQFLVEHLDPDDLPAAEAEPKTVTYHDSCFLGTHNDVTAEPRALLEWLPGYEFVDIDSRALCCGGGGGRMWYEDPMVEERPAQPVVELAMDREADVLAVACPFCATNFEEARLTNDLEDAFEVKDISELVAEALDAAVA